MPGFEILDVPENEINVGFVQRNCNYLQALEGEIDTSHFGFLHAGHVNIDDVAEDEPVAQHHRQPRARISCRRYALGHAIRRLSYGRPGQTYWRFANFLFPFWTQAPNGEFQSHMHARAWVPLDDHHTMFVFIWWKHAKAANSMPTPLFKNGQADRRRRARQPALPNSTDWLGRWRMADTQDNDWGIDREAQRSNRIYSGIDGIHLQDQAITESMGSVTDFTHEHLAPSDQMITRTRRRLLMAARALGGKGVMPPGADDPQVYRGARSGYLVSDDQSDWREVYSGQLAAAMHPGAVAPGATAG